MSNGFELSLSGRRRLHAPHSQPKDPLHTHIYQFGLLGDKHHNRDTKAKKSVEFSPDVGFSDSTALPESIVTCLRAQAAHVFPRTPSPFAQ
jgi:hypothetical protein